MFWSDVYAHDRCYSYASMTTTCPNNRKHSNLRPSVNKPTPRAMRTQINSKTQKKIAQNQSAIVPMKKTVVIALIFVCAISLSGVFASMVKPIPVQAQPVEVSMPQETIVPYIKSPNASYMQFAQSGEPWSDLGYWGDNVALNGCGLCCYTTIVDILTDSSYTPETMLSIRGDWQGMDNYVEDNTGLINGMTHGQFTFDTFGINSFEVDCSIGSLALQVSRGDTVAMVCAGGDDIFVDAYGGIYSYPGHFICVWTKNADGTYLVHDSAVSHGRGCNVTYSAEQMETLIEHSSSIVAYRA